MRAIAISPSLNRSGASQSKIYLAPRRFLRLLHEGPHNHDTLYSGSHVQRPRNAAAAFQSHFPETAFNMLGVGLPPLAPSRSARWSPRYEPASPACLQANPRPPRRQCYRESRPSSPNFTIPISRVVPARVIIVEPRVTPYE